MSFNVWAGWFPLSFMPGLAKATIFDILDHLTSNVLLPLGGLALAVFGGRVVPASLLADELELGARTTALLRFVLRYVATPAIVLVATAVLLLRQ
jgi:NSS family neurotransmitter:Na+ symporter